MIGSSSRLPGDSAHLPRAVFEVRVTPRSSRPSLALGPDGALLVRVSAAPVDGSANKAVLKLIADSLRIAPSRVSLVSGHQSRCKRVMIEGLLAEDVRNILLTMPGARPLT